jgi:hypothetical protein
MKPVRLLGIAILLLGLAVVLEGVTEQDAFFRSRMLRMAVPICVFGGGLLLLVAWAKWHR